MGALGGNGPAGIHFSGLFEISNIMPGRIKEEWMERRSQLEALSDSIGLVVKKVA